jgi:hypothetical protein
VKNAQVETVGKVNGTATRMLPKDAPSGRDLIIQAPQMQTALFTIVGTAPLVVHAFGAKAKKQMRDKQIAGSTAKKGKGNREPRDFDQDYEEAKYVSRDGWLGVNASGFRCGLVGVCRVQDFKMTLAKLSIFVEADGFDRNDGTPLVKITKGEPHKVEHMARNDNGGADFRVRPMWDEGWEMDVRIRFDARQFTLMDVANLLATMGAQGGIGEGRASSKMSCGMGWGFFRIKEQKELNG